MRKAAVRLPLGIEGRMFLMMEEWIDRILSNGN
ncbi:MAG: hypothetical protein DVB22_002289 [Verrucomicrobia bacterium]|jgi:hypothetical protein|nr:MAG: hypothetical protein DVB22_002289 [Verrucomicrobiota bacterium]